MSSIMLTSSATAPLLVCATAILLYLLHRRLIFKPIPGIPYNKHAAYTLMGDAPMALKKIKEEGGMFPWLISHTVKYDTPVFQVFMQIGQKPWVIVADFKEGQDAMVRRAKDFDRSELVTDLFTGVTPDMHIVMKTNDTFKAHRKLINDLMTPGFLNNVAAPHVYATAQNLVKYWSFKSQLAQDRPFDASLDIFNFALDSISAVSFGLDVNDGVLSLMTKDLQATPKVTVSQTSGAAEFILPDRPQKYAALVKLMEGLGDTLKSPVPRLYHWFLRQGSAYKKANSAKENMIREELENALARFESGDKTQRCALDYVLQSELKAAKKANRPPQIRDNRVIYDELLGFLFAGHDTTGSTMCWGWKHLAANPQVQTELRTRLRAAFPDAIAEGRDPTYQEIISTSIPYLDATIEEINRHAQVFPFVFRTTMSDVTVLGHYIPKGTTVMFCQSGPSFFSAPFDIPDSLRSESYRAAKHSVGEWDVDDMPNFRPERFLKKDENEREFYDPNAGPVMPFALGPRGCYGRRLAYLQLRVFVVMVMWNFELLPVEGDLGNFKIFEKLTTVPQKTYLRLKVLEK